MTDSPAKAAAHRVLLVDDQPFVAEALRDLVGGEPDILLSYCQDPSRAIEAALAFRPTVILQDLVMPDIDGMTLVRYFRAHETLRHVPLVVLSSKEEPATKAEAFAAGANDYLVKLPDRVELLARIRHHSGGYLAHRARDAAEAALRAELDEAARYVRRLLPPPDPAAGIDWRLVNCSALAGDALDVFPLQDGRLAFYVLDVCGHGVGAALLSTGILLALRARSLPGADYARPDTVLDALNRAFPAGDDGKYFTIWYGVLDPAARTLAYAGGGHPPAVFLPDSPGTDPLLFKAKGPIVGVFPEASYTLRTVTLPAPGHLCLYSDGAYEIPLPSGATWPHAEFVAYLAGRPPATRLDDLLARVRAMTPAPTLDDDFTILSLRVP